MWKLRKFTFTEKIFRQITYLVISLVILLLSRKDLYGIGDNEVNINSWCFEFTCLYFQKCENRLRTLFTMLIDLKWRDF